MGARGTASGIYRLLPRFWDGVLVLDAQVRADQVRTGLARELESKATALAVALARYHDSLDEKEPVDGRILLGVDHVLDLMQRSSAEDARAAILEAGSCSFALR